MHHKFNNNWIFDLDANAKAKNYEYYLLTKFKTNNKLQHNNNDKLISNYIL